MASSRAVPPARAGRLLRAKLRAGLRAALAAPPLLWVLAGFAPAYVLFFLQPVFWAAPVMQFPQTVPVMDPSGNDLRINLHLTAAWLAHGHNPYTDVYGYAYPPLTILVFAPLLAVSVPAAYQIVTTLTLAALVASTLLLPWRLARPRPASALLMLIFLSALFSYGFHFELERGQFNLIAVGLSLLAVWLFHHRPRWRLLAYGLFTLAVQLKLYPFIFILLLVRDWRAWRANLRRLALLAGLNFAALFMLGPGLGVAFLRALADHVTHTYVWPGNHSVYAFVTLVVKQPAWAWLAPYAGALQVGLLGLVGGGLGLVSLQAFRHRRPGLYPPLLLACALAALVIPSTSHDYTLAYLAAPVAVLVTQWRLPAGPRPRQAAAIGLLVLGSAAYAATLFSYTHKPRLLDSNFPALLLMLAVTTALAFVAPPPSTPPNVSEPP